MINHLFLYKGRGSLLILSFTSSTDKWNAALVILAIALFSRSWFPLFRILPQTASWYQTPAAIILQQQGSTLTVSASDPQRMLQTLTITINIPGYHTVTQQDSQIHVTQ